MTLLHAPPSWETEFTPGTTGPEDSIFVNSPSESRREQWRHLMSSDLAQLAERADEEYDEEDETVPPTFIAMGKAFDLATGMRDAPEPPPVPRVISDGDGGIFFRWDADGITVEISPAGATQLVKMEDCRVVFKADITW